MIRDDAGEEEAPAVVKVVDQELIGERAELDVVAAGADGTNKIAILELLWGNCFQTLDLGGMAVCMVRLERCQKVTT